MTKTWDDNRELINGLWPLSQLTPEEADLWRSDLSGLDQGVLFDALRNVKRNNDSNYPQLKWVRDEYRGLHRIATVRRLPQSAPNYEPPAYDDGMDKRIGDELRAVVESATADEYRGTISLIADKAAKALIRMPTAFRLVSYLNARLGYADGGAP